MPARRETSDKGAPVMHGGNDHPFVPAGGLAAPIDAHCRRGIREDLESDVMLGMTSKRKIRRRQVREQRAKVAGTWWNRTTGRAATWSTAISVLFVLAASAISLYGEATVGHSIGERLDQPIYARVDFQVTDASQTAADREAARAATPSHYKLNARAITFDRVRADLKRLYQAAADANTLEEYEQALVEFNWPAKPEAYRRLRADQERDTD